MAMNRKTAYSLYTCHALSTWCSRSYEFSATIFTAAAYPGGIRAASLIGISTSLAAICFASSLGRWIDNAPSRLRTLITTIAVNRISTLVACLFWFLIVADPSQTSVLNGRAKFVAFIAILVVGVLENLSGKANVLTIERDWVPILASAVVAKRYPQDDLAHVNAVMARIDIGCKLIAPIAISGLNSVLTTTASLAVVAGSNALIFGFELWTALKVWENSADLRVPKPSTLNEVEVKSTRSASFNQRLGLSIVKAGSSIAAWWRAYVDSFRLYFSFKVCRASLAMTMTQVSVLSVTGVLIPLLLNSGFSLKVITVAEVASALFELGSTVVTPFAIKRLTPRPGLDTNVKALYEPGGRLENIGELSPRPADYTKAAVTKVGFSGILFMLATLIPAVPVIFYLTSTLSYPIPPSKQSPTFFDHTAASVILFLCLSASRLGRGTFSLTTQQLSQSQVSASHRSSFGGTELVFVSIFGLSHNVGAAILSEPRQFGWLALGSVTAIAASVVVFVWFMRQERISISRLKFWGKLQIQGYEAVALEPIPESEPNSPTV